jgi:hypothetical protein
VKEYKLEEDELTVDKRLPGFGYCGKENGKLKLKNIKFQKTNIKKS